jgi:hypothetical protein
MREYGYLIGCVRECMWVSMHTSVYVYVCVVECVWVCAVHLFMCTESDKHRSHNTFQIKLRRKK